MNRLKNITVTVFLSLTTLMLSAQDKPATEKDNRPVKEIFGNGLIFDQQTDKTLLPGAFEFVIEHRFGTVTNGIKDLYGIYSSSNIRLAMNYGVTKYLTIGFGTERFNKLQDLSWKLAILKQTRSNSIPLSLTYYGNVVLDGRPKTNFGDSASYKYIHRLSFFNQLIISRKFSDKFSFQVAPSVSYFNAVNPGYSNLNYSLSFGGKLKLYNKLSFIAGYDMPLQFSEENYFFKPKSNLSFGLEVGSPTHTFQVFVTNSNALNDQYGLSFNTGSFENNMVLVGMNITVRF